jgi:thiamine transport system ATP-binding protein
MLSVRGVSVRFGDLLALDGVGLTVADDEVVALLGPSGSGKSTLLRVVVGLQEAETGTVTWDGADISRLPTHRREFGLVFQDYALFPHLDVAGNVAFGLRMRGAPASRREQRVTEVLALVGLEGFGGRAVGTLSGGQAQRVALARALAPAPRMLLLDEPLGALDRALREELAVDLAGAIRTAGVPALYVTHDQREAFTVADRIAVMDEGRVVQAGSPGELWRTPASPLVARLLGLRTVLDASVKGGVARTALGDVAVDRPDGPIRLVVRPEALVPLPGGSIEATAIGSTYRGGDHLITADVNGTRIEFLAQDPPPPGETLRLHLDTAGVSVIPETQAV